MSSVYSLSSALEDKNLLGNKGTNLATMTRLGLPVPPGFAIAVDAYKEYMTIVQSCLWPPVSML